MSYYSKDYQNPQHLLTALQSTQNFHTSLPDINSIFDSVNYYYLQRYRWNSEFYNQKIGGYENGYDHLKELLIRYNDDIELRKNLLVLLNLFESCFKNKIVNVFGKYHPLLYVMDIYNRKTLDYIKNSLNQQEFSTKVHFYQKYKGSAYQGIEFNYPPIWKGIHCFSLGTLCNMYDIDLNKLKLIRLDRANAIKKQLRKWLSCSDAKHYHQKLNDILWLRNCVAHFDHIIGRSPEYYPPAYSSNTNNKWSNVSVGYKMKWINEKLYDSNGNLTSKSFAWYFELLFNVLDNVLVLSEHRDLANIHIVKIHDTAKKYPGFIQNNSTYTHLGFSDSFLDSPAPKL